MTTIRTAWLATAPRLPLAAALPALFALAACGGGNHPDIPFDSKPITVTGTVATSNAATPSGTALAAVPVTLDCRNGHATAMTDANGNYSMTTSGLSSGPCVVTATIPAAATSTVLRAIAAGSGSVANVTPLTEALVQYVATQSALSPAQNQPATALASSNTFQALAAGDATFGASSARVVAVLQANMVAPAVAVPADFLTGQLIARTAANPGNAQSLVLEQLRGKALTTVAGQTAATVLGATGQPSAQILLRLGADAKTHLLP